MTERELCIVDNKYLGLVALHEIAGFVDKGKVELHETLEIVRVMIPTPMRGQIVPVPHTMLVPLAFQSTVPVIVVRPAFMVRVRDMLEADRQQLLAARDAQLQAMRQARAGIVSA